MLLDFFDSLKEAWRIFQYDYIYIDAFFLLIWIGLLIKKKKWNPMIYGIIFGICVYIIDAVAWFNIPENSNYPPGTYIREYWIGGVYMPRPLGDYFWVKFGADFMMTLSYSMFAFAWLWIAFENIKKKDIKEVFLFTTVFFTSWLLTPFISFWLPINDTIVETVRHMDSQFILWIVNGTLGYIILYIIYGTNRFKSKNPKIIFYVLIIGFTESFFMEFPLFITGIRPTGVLFLIYEIFILFNQGAPYLFILYDKVLPWLFRKLKKIDLKRKKKIELIIKR